jgi:hypothetical protein
MNRSSGLGFKPTGRAFPPFGLAQDSGSMAAFVALYSCGAAGEFHPFPWHPSAADNVFFNPSFD